MQLTIKEVETIKGFDKAYMLESYCMDSILTMNKTKQGLIRSLYNLGHDPGGVNVLFFDTWYIVLID